MRYSWPFIPTLLIAWVLNMSDRVFIERYLGMQDLGIYSMAYKLSMAFLVITSSFSLAFTPFFHKVAELGNESKNELSIKIDKVIRIFIYVFFQDVFCPERWSLLFI
ncbi:lipopolysaccharide biosynthesis protein [Vibrio taketomensis]|uniref:lipopolysaccharide biosynthesis protein n=1 Tax=Vibrio taketomensis TaxID=2572923 RepID=UPI00138A3E28